MYRLLFVCTGNICRSPTAEAVFRHKVTERGVQNDFGADSAGTHGYHVGDPPDRRSVMTAQSRGVDMAGLSARKASQEDFEQFDLILALDRGHYGFLENMDPGGHADLKLFLDYYPRYQGQDVPDPYYGGQEGFDYVFDLINQGAEHLLKELTDC